MQLLIDCQASLFYMWYHTVQEFDNVYWYVYLYNDDWWENETRQVNLKGTAKGENANELICQIGQQPINRIENGWYWFAYQSSRLPRPMMNFRDIDSIFAPTQWQILIEKLTSP